MDAGSVRALAVSTGTQARMRHRASHETRMQEVRDFDVVDEPATSAHSATSSMRRTERPIWVRFVSESDVEIGCCQFTAHVTLCALAVRKPALVPRVGEGVRGCRGNASVALRFVHGSGLV